MSNKRESAGSSRYHLGSYQHQQSWFRRWTVGQIEIDSVCLWRQANQNIESETVRWDAIQLVTW